MAEYTSLDLSTFLVRGERYTITVVEPILEAGRDVTYVLSKVNTISIISQVSVSKVGWNWDIKFTYVGDGADVVANVSGAILEQLATWYASWEFAGAYTGDKGAAQTQQDTTKVDIPLPTTSTLVLLVIGLGLIVFLASGGATIARRTAGA